MKEKKDIKLAELLATMPPPDWIREMRRHYQVTGSYRAEDVRRILGDPQKESELRKHLDSATRNQVQKR